MEDKMNKREQQTCDTTELWFWEDYGIKPDDIYVKDARPTGFKNGKITVKKSKIDICQESIPDHYYGFSVVII